MEVIALLISSLKVQTYFPIKSLEIEQTKSGNNFTHMQNS